MLVSPTDPLLFFASSLTACKETLPEGEEKYFTGGTIEVTSRCKIEVVGGGMGMVNITDQNGRQILFWFPRENRTETEVEAEAGSTIEVIKATIKRTKC